MGYWRNMSLILAISLTTLHFSHANNAPEDYVNAHNAPRKEVGVGPMTWNNTVAKFAEHYANKRKGDCALRHSKSEYGENIARGSGDFSGVDAVNLWAGEKPNYDYESNTCVDRKPCAHYTQLVWKDSVRIGCARVKCNNNEWFVTCNYDPPGNYIGEKPY